MAYTASTLALKAGTLANQGPATWTHRSADATGDVDAAGFFATAGLYGVKVGDIIEHTNTTTAAAQVTTAHIVNTVDATTGATNVSVGVVIGTGGTSGD